MLLYIAVQRYNTVIGTLQYFCIVQWFYIIVQIYNKVAYADSSPSDTDPH